MTGQYPPRFFVRNGDGVTLPCKAVPVDQDKCDRIHWLFRASEMAALVQLTKRRQIGENAKNGCSLVIQKVRVEDAGRYSCRCPGHQETPVDVSVVNSEYLYQNVFS